MNDTRKDLHWQGLLWNYKDDDDQNVDVIPAEIAAVIRRDHAGQELQTANYRRRVSHDAILVVELRAVLYRREADRSGNKADLIERVVGCGVRPSAVLDELDTGAPHESWAAFGGHAGGRRPGPPSTSLSARPLPPSSPIGDNGPVTVHAT